MTDVAAVGRLRQRGEVPPTSTDDRRRWLTDLAEDELIALTRRHGADQDVFATCWGWGAVGSGTDDGTTVRCSRCGRKRPPLWFLEPDQLGTPQKRARCWKCAAIDHLTDCDLWEMP